MQCKNSFCMNLSKKKLDMELLWKQCVWMIGFSVYICTVFTNGVDVTINNMIISGTSELRNITGLSGKISGDILQFKGLPYAKAPTATRRFKQPEIHPMDVNGPYNAKEFKKICNQVQNPAYRKPWMGVNQTFLMGEDCLYLNIYVPKAISNNDLKAVMVFIHGGGFVSGSSNEYHESATVMSIMGDVIIVTLNYRLGVFGFLSVPNTNIRGNMGLYDQVTALKWVQRHINVFGGDKNRVTIFGQSAGAASVGFLSVSDMTSGLFNRAISQSGSLFSYFAEVSEEKMAQGVDELAKELSCSNKTSDRITCLENVDEKNLTLNALKVGRSYFIPTIDGQLVKSTSQEDFHSQENAGLSRFRDLDFLTGVNSMELKGQLAKALKDLGINPMGPSFNIAQLKQIGKVTITNILKEEYDVVTEPMIQAVEVLFLQQCELDPYEPKKYLKNLAQALGSVSFLAPSAVLAKTHTESNPNGSTYAYFFEFESGFLGPAYPWSDGADHLDELAYVTGIVNVLPSYGLTSKEHERYICGSMLSYWTNFAKSGNPNKPETVSYQGWPEYDKSDYQYLYVDESPNNNKVEKHFGEAAIPFWYSIMPSLSKTKTMEPIKKPQEDCEMIRFMGQNLDKPTTETLLLALTIAVGVVSLLGLVFGCAAVLEMARNKSCGKSESKLG